jgi:hypothetical protein
MPMSLTLYAIATPSKMCVSPLEPQQIARGWKRPIRRVALACTQCRSRKLKCNTNFLFCRRRHVDGKSCVYHQSRRGGRPRRPTTMQSQTVRAGTPPLFRDQTTSPWAWSWAWGRNPGTTTASHPTSCKSSASGSTTNSIQNIVDASDSLSHLCTITRDVDHLTQSQIDKLLTNYYTYFHVASPCVLPRSSLLVRLATDASASEVFLLVLLYVGSITHCFD